MLTGKSVEQSLDGAACSLAEQQAGQRQAPEEAPAPPAAAALKERAVVMFSGKTGAPEASGEDAAAKEPTLRLIRDAFQVVDGLNSALFDKNAEERPCGGLDKGLS